MSYVCPICRGALEREGGSYRCEKNHSFDLSRSGYLNLLPSSKMNSKLPGDNKEMVRARREFLDGGYYEHLRRALSDMALRVSPSHPVYFDAGVGTGYYTEGVKRALDCPEVIGVDISKFAVEASAKRIKDGFFAVASLYDLPIPDESVDLVTCVFSPMANEELLRIMKKGAHLLYVVPAPMHLFEMKEILYDEPYQNDLRTVTYEGFSEVGRERVEFSARLRSREDISNLFQMTPYAYRTSPEGKARLLELDALSLTFDFYIIDFVKE